MSMSTSNKAKVLYVEHNPFKRKIISFVLEAQGLNVKTTGDGQDGVNIALEWLPDLVLTDLKAPKLDGFQLAQTLRAHPHTNHIPIVAYTDNPHNGTWTKAQSAGINRLIPKQISSSELFDLLRLYIPGSSEKPG